MTDPVDLTEKLEARRNATPRAIRADDVVAEIRRLLGEADIVRLYQQHILSQRTRRFELQAPSKTVPVEVQHTLLGIELKIGNRRLLCPDFATARYLAVFARIGLEAVAVPYDITQMSRLADEIESSWHRMIVLVEHLTAGRSARLRNLVRTHLVALWRNELTALGAGNAIPEFNQNTKQRRPWPQPVKPEKKPR